MDACLAACDDVCGHQRRQAAQPKARSFHFTVAVLPWLDDLIRAPDRRRQTADRIFDRDPRYRRRHQFAHKRDGGPLIRTSITPPPRARRGQKRARRMKDREIPAVIEDRPHIAPEMLTAVAVHEIT